MIAAPLKPDEETKKQRLLSSFTGSTVDIRLVDEVGFTGKVTRTTDGFLCCETVLSPGQPAVERLIPWSSVVYIQKVAS